MQEITQKIIYDQTLEEFILDTVAAGKPLETGLLPRDRSTPRLFTHPLGRFWPMLGLCTIPFLVFLFVFMFNYQGTDRRPYLWLNYLFLALLIATLFAKAKTYALSLNCPAALKPPMKFLAIIGPFLSPFAIFILYNTNRYRPFRPLRTGVDAFYLLGVIMVILLFLLCYAQLKDQRIPLAGRFREIFPAGPIFFASLYMINTEFIRLFFFGRPQHPYNTLIFIFFFVVVLVVGGQMAQVTQATKKDVSFSIICAGVSVLLAFVSFLYAFLSGFSDRISVGTLFGLVLCILFVAAYKLAHAQK